MKSLVAVLLSSLLLLVSCSSMTDAFVSDAAWSDIPVEDKLEAYGAVHVRVPMPECYFDGTEWLGRITEEIEKAENYILISTFLGSSSENLEVLYDAIAEKAQSGVRVYFIMDGTSSFDMTETQYYMTPLYFLRDSGVHLLEYSPISTMRLLNPMELVIRDHRKMFVIDGKMAAIGGLNINYISMGAGEGKTQRDSMYLFDSPALSEVLMHAFVDSWNAESVERLDYADFAVYPDQGGVYDAYLFNSGPGGSGSIAGMFASLIGSAEESIVLLPYLPVLDENMEKSLSRAEGRGVSVDIIMPVDLRGYAAGGIYHYLPDLIRNTGADVSLSIYDEDGNVLPLLHEKLMIVDSEYAVIGSSNFNFRSMGLSHEMSLVIRSKELAAYLEEHVAAIKRISTPISLEEAEKLKGDEGNALSYLFMYYGG